MKKCLLTSAGFENPTIKEAFLALVGKDPAQIRALWVPTAAADEEARAVLAECMKDLFDAGLQAENIMVYHLEEPMLLAKLRGYDAIYFCGGSPEYLMKHIQRVRFAAPLRQFAEEGGVYVGVSAGSIVAAANMRSGLQLANCVLHVHCEAGEQPGEIPLASCPQVRLTNSQALWIAGQEAEIIA